jgi:hypothetical protein
MDLCGNGPLLYFSFLRTFSSWYSFSRLMDVEWQWR